MANPDRFSTAARLQRLNKKIRRLDGSQQERKDQLVKQRKRLQQKQGMENLSDPNKALTGRDLLGTARSQEKLISQAGIDAQRQLIKQLAEQTQYDTGKLESMGGRLANQMRYLGNRMDEYGREAYTNAQNLKTETETALERQSTEAMDRTNQLQSSVLGQQISALQGQNVAPDSSGTSQIMGQFAQAQQQGAANSAASWQNLGTMLGAANVANTAAGTTASKNSLNNTAIDIQRNISSRVADRMFQGSQDKSEAQSKLATLKSLRGAELVNQMMKLRGTERDYMDSKQKNALEKMGIIASAREAAADRALKKYEIDTEAASDSGSGGSGGSDGSGGGDDISLNRQEWRNYKDAADQHLAKIGGKVGNWNNFLDAVGEIEGVNWTATERRKFAKKYKQLYG